METCQNCGQKIGKLETPFLWREKIVCAPCFQKLNLSATPPIQVSPAPPERAMAAGDVICPNPNCGYHGPAKKQPKGSTMVLLILLFCFFIPGLIYLILYQGYTLVCPRCGAKVRDA